VQEFCLSYLRQVGGLHVSGLHRGGTFYDNLYCGRGQAENLIKLHKSQLASDRTGCRSALANQVRLVLHTAAYWLVLAVRDAIPKPRDSMRPRRLAGEPTRLRFRQHTGHGSAAGSAERSRNY
jgi:Transposase DDE domain group 1